MNILSVDIAFATNEKYAHPIPVIIESISRNCSLRCRFFIVHSTLNEQDRNDILKISKLTNNDVIFINFDTEKYINSCKLELESFRNCYDSYTRIFLPQILKPFNVERCLYLDTDLVINNNFDPLIKDLYSIDFLGGTYDETSKKNFNWLPNNTINSGVLLLNLVNLENFSFTEKFLNFARENSPKYKELYDQDIINAILTDREKTILDPRYNVIHSETDSVKNGIILHYTGPIKPWMSQYMWRYKKCIWLKYKILCKLRLRGIKCGPVINYLLHNFLIRFRVIFNTIYKIKKLFGLLK